MNKRTAGDILFDGINIIIMCFMMFVCLYPFVHVVLASVSDSNLLMGYNGLLYKPLGFSLQAYKEVIQHPMIKVGYRNTIFYVLAGTTLSTLLTIAGGFVLSRRDLVIRKFMTILVMITMFFGGGLIPTYLLIKEINIYDSVWAILLPTAINTYNMIVMRTSFEGIPRSLEEAATIDGANELVILTRVIVPLSKSTIAVIVLFYGVGLWNQWFQAAMYLNNRDLYPLQLFLREILINSDTDSMMAGNVSVDRVAISESIKYATIVVATAPILCIYPFLQKYFVKGVMIGAVKG